MIGIEKEEEDRERIEFNQPYNCIKLHFGNSNEILPRLSWEENEKTIAWLDYDIVLDMSVLNDIRFYCTSASAGSILLITVDANPDKLGEPGKRLTQLKKNVGTDKLPGDVEEKHLPDWGTAMLYRKVIHNEIKEIITARNGGLSEGSKLFYKQLYYFLYSDGTNMLSVGGLLYDEEMLGAVENITFENLSFLRFGTDPYIINVPNLTIREKRILDTKLPRENLLEMAKIPVPEEDIGYYAELYRWFPTFTEAEL
jgi:hypothetical protein